MTHLAVRTVIDAPPDLVWRRIEDISTHVSWMAEAQAIRFRTEERSGVGAEFDCDTRVGPFTTTDRMRVTYWEPPCVMGIEHVGAVRGNGRFTLQRLRDGRTMFRWTEELTFPWWMGGAVGAVVGAFLLHRVWRRNLDHLRRMCEADA